MPRAVLVLDAKLSGTGTTWFWEQFGEQLSEPAGVLGMRQFKRVAPGQFATGVAQIAERGRLGIVKDDAGRVDQRNAIGTLFYQRAEPFLVLLQDLLGLFPLGNVLDDADRIERLAIMPANQGCGHVRPDDLLAFGDV